MRTFFSSSIVKMFVVGVTMIVAVILFSCAKTDNSTNPPVTSTSPTVHAPLVSTAPTIDGDASDGVWSAATPTTVHMKPIAVPGNTLTNEFDVQVRAVHTTTDIYFLVSYPDADADEMPNKLVYMGGNISDTANWKNQDNGQDGFSFMWDLLIGGVAAHDGGGKFSDSSYGCTAACHAASSNPAPLESGMYPLKGGVDLWFWNAGTTNPQGYADDQFAVGSDSNGTGQDSRRCKDRSEQYFALPIYSEAKHGYPDLMAGSTNNNLDFKKFLWYSTAVSFDGTMNNPATSAPWTSGDVVPGWGCRIQSKLPGEADVRAKGVHSSIGWTIEWSRALTNSDADRDVQFDVTPKLYSFSISTHQNARKFTSKEYEKRTNYQPEHYGCIPRRLVLSIE